MSKNSSNSIISFFVGLLLGGVFGVLFAPDRGNNTRDRLTYRLNKYKLRIQDLLEEILEDKEIKNQRRGKEEKKVTTTLKIKQKNY